MWLRIARADIVSKREVIGYERKMKGGVSKKIVEASLLLDLSLAELNRIVSCLGKSRPRPVHLCLRNQRL